MFNSLERLDKELRKYRKWDRKMSLQLLFK